jgi:hypothetical protein
MSNTIQIKRSSTAASVPTAGQLAVGELAVNLADRKLFTKNASNVVVPVTNAPDSGFSFRNRIINGDMRIDQRNAGAGVAISDSTVTYTVDRWAVFENTDGALSVQRVADAPPSFINSARVTVTTADASLAAGQRTFFYQQIEGFNVADLGWGTANAATVTLSFWVKSSITGQFGAAVLNSAANRSYPFGYTISSANTWEQKSVTIPGDTTGTWLTDNGSGLQIIFGLGVGSSFSGTAGAWVAANINSVTGSVNFMATLSATWQVTGVQLEAGSVATPFERRPYGTELALCQRYYYQMVSPSASEKYFASGFYYSASLFAATYSFPVTMRTTPTLAYVTGTGFYQIYTSGTQDVINGLTAVRLHPNGGGFDSDNPSTSGIQGAGGAISTNNAAAAVGFNAEL